MSQNFQNCIIDKYNDNYNLKYINKNQDWKYIPDDLMMLIKKCKRNILFPLSNHDPLNIYKSNCNSVNLTNLTGKILDNDTNRKEYSNS